MAEEVGTYTIPVILSFRDTAAQVGKDFGSSMGKAGSKAAGDFGKAFAKSSEADIKKASDSYAKLYDKQADAAGKLRTELAKLEDLQKRGVSGGRLVSQTERVEKARRDETRAVKVATESYKDYEKAVKDASSAGEGGGGFLDKIKNLGSSGKEAGAGFLEGFGGPIGELGSKAGPIGMALASAAALALGAGTLIATQVMAGIDKEAQADVVAAKFGFDDATMAKIADSSGKAYANNFGDSVNENMSGAAAAIQNGLVAASSSGADIQGTVEKLSVVSTVLGVDIPEAARSAGQLIKTGFAKDFATAADLIVAGSQSGLNVSEDWLDTVNEYSTQFRKLGISGPEALGLLSQAVQGGARDTDVAADALKEFSIRAIDGSKSTMGAFHTLGMDFESTTDAFAKGGPAAHDMFQQVLTGIQSIQDPYTKAQVQVALFGTQSEDLGDALNKLDLSNAVEQIGNVDGAAQRASDTLGGNTASSIESAKRSIEVATSGMQSSLADAFGPTLEQFAGFITMHQDDITGFFQTAAAAGVEFAAGFGIVIGGVIRTWGLLISGVGDGVGFIIDGFESLAGGLSVVAHAVGADGLGDALDSAKTQLGDLSDGLHGFGEDTIKFGDDIVGASLQLHDMDTSFGATRGSAEAAAGQIANVKEAMAGLPGGKNIDINAIVIYKDTNGLVIPPGQLTTPVRVAATPGGTAPTTGGGRAEGGSISGPGGPTSDIIPIWASNGEHMLPADEVNMLGGQAGVYRLRAMIRSGGFGKYATGGAIGGIDALYEEASALVGHPYSMASGDDCSGSVSQLVNAVLGLPPKADRMSTMTASKWLTEKGALLGMGPTGTFRIGWKNGGPGGGHMAATLPDGTNVEQGGSTDGFTMGANAAGADDPQFTNHAYLPMEALYPDGVATGGAQNPYGMSTGGGTAGVGPNGEAGTYEVDQKAVREADQKVADADWKVKQAETKLKELDADAKESQKQDALKDVEDAKREAQDARTDATTAKKGKFTAAKGGKSGGGSGDLSEIGSIFGSFLKETTGFDGSLFPDIGSLMPVQMANTLLGALIPSGDGGASPMAATSSSSFGMPDVAAPPAPAGTAASGIGMGPQPGPSVTIDQSIHGNVGASYEDVQKKRDAGLNRAVTRIPVGA